MEMFKMFNNNPNNKITQDCVIRSLSSFLNIDYYTVLKELMEIYINTGFHIADPVCFMYYLKKLKNVKQTNILYPKVITLKSLCTDLINNKYNDLENITPDNYKKILVLLNNTHLTYLENGCIIDTWDCSDLNVQAYFTFVNN